MLDLGVQEGESLGSPPPAIYRFGLFEVDSRSGEVRKAGVRIKLQDQPLQVLLKLLEQYGDVVSRDELRTALWRDDTFVDFDAGLNTVMRRLRDALGDSADNPTLIETIPRRGYRFIAPVDKITSPDKSETPRTISFGPWFQRKQRAWAAIGTLLALIAVLALLRFRTSPLVDNPLRFVQLTNDGLAKSGRLLSDGKRVYFSELTPGRRTLVQVSRTGGEVLPVPTVLENPRPLDISPDGAQILAVTGEGEEPLPLWMLPVAGGSPRRIGSILANDAAWCPDEDRLVYASGHDIFFVRKDGSGSQRLVTVGGFPGGLCWSPDGRKLSFHVWDPADASVVLWEVAADGTDLHPLLPSSSGLGSSCCGTWSRASGIFLFQVLSEVRTDVWAIPWGRRWWPWASAAPVRLTSGPMNFSDPAVNPGDARELFVIGTLPRAELVRYDSSSGQFLPYLAGISAEGVDFARDRQWAAYTSYPDGALWRCRVDGGERRQLTFPPMRTFMPRWSPNGSSIAFVDISEKPWKIRVISSEGTGLRQVSPAGEAASDATWSPGGDRLAFGGVDITHADEPAKFAIHVLELATGQLTTLPGPTGLFSPRWSPDGRYMAAVNAAAELTILDLAGESVFTLSGLKVGFPIWSRAGDFVYFQDRTGARVPTRILRLSLPGRKLETVVQLEGIGRLPLGTFASWSGLTPDGAPILSRDIGGQEIYSMRW
jgi:DNA-binding winged helix-turn-helix (wHTH) protein/Tol biopolymer transport system component